MDGAQETVLGVDPGLTRCGIGVITGSPRSPRVLLATVVRTPPGDPIERRLRAVHEAIAAVMTEHRPDVLACERVLFSGNARTAMGVGQAAGVALLAAAQAGVPVVSYSPNEVKLTVAGHGSADKDGVARMTAMQLGLAEPPTPADVTDALAVALCHLARHGSPGSPVGPGTGGGGWEAVLARPHIRIAGGVGVDPEEMR